MIVAVNAIYAIAYRSLQKPEKNSGLQRGLNPWPRDLPVRCPTNWAMKPLTLGAGQLWVHMFPWKKWVLIIYEINHEKWKWKWKWRNGRRSEATIRNCNPQYHLITLISFTGMLVGGSGLEVKISWVGSGLFWHNSFRKQQCSLEALTGKYLVLFKICPSHWAESGLHWEW